MMARKIEFVSTCIAMITFKPRISTSVIGWRCCKKSSYQKANTEHDDILLGHTLHNFYVSYLAVHAIEDNVLRC